VLLAIGLLHTLKPILVEFVNFAEFLEDDGVGEFDGDAVHNGMIDFFREVHVPFDKDESEGLIDEVVQGNEFDLFDCLLFLWFEVAEQWHMVDWHNLEVVGQEGSLIEADKPKFGDLDQ
jgi:hypothetical protein